MAPTQPELQACLLCLWQRQRQRRGCPRGHLFWGWLCYMQLAGLCCASLLQGQRGISSLPWLSLWTAISGLPQEKDSGGAVRAVRLSIQPWPPPLITAGELKRRVRCAWRRAGGNRLQDLPLLPAGPAGALARAAIARAVQAGSEEEGEGEEEGSLDEDEGSEGNALLGSWAALGLQRSQTSKGWLAAFALAEPKRFLQPALCTLSTLGACQRAGGMPAGRHSGRQVAEGPVRQAWSGELSTRAGNTSWQQGESFACRGLHRGRG